MNTIKAWILAARPRTLTASLSPVFVGSALAYSEGFFHPVPAILCLLVALFAQIASNFANDYFDHKKGADGSDRLGPARAVASGWIPPRKMLAGTFITLGIALICGIALLYYGGIWLLPMGAAVVLSVLAYSAGPFPLAYNGLGDICVLIFYGIVPVNLTYYLQTGHFSLMAFLVSLSIGLFTTNILVVNNYRDYAEDKSNEKRTTVVLFGRKFAKVFYLANGVAALLLIIPLAAAAPAWIKGLYAVFMALFFFTWRELQTNEGKALNITLGRTARNVLLFALLVCLTCLSGKPIIG